MELQIYIKNIASFLGIVNIISIRIQDHQYNILIQCDYHFTSQLSTNYINFHQGYEFKIKTEQYTPPPKLYTSLCIPQQTHDTDPMGKSPHIMKPPLLPHHQNYLRQHINLTKKSKPCVLDLITCSLSLIKDMINNMKN